MLQTNILTPGHADLVTHITYDFYGERLATCSADQKIKIFRRTTEGSWDQESEWKAHDAPLLHLSFAHPIHGSLLASSSHDRSVRIWEEPTGRERDGRWIERGILIGAKGSVRSVEFGPADPAFGLRVASIATDSHLRIYTSLDPSLSDWSLVHDIYVPSIPAPGSIEESANAPTESANGGGNGNTNELSQGGWGISWCKERWWGSIIATFSGLSPIVKIISLDPTPTSLIHLTPPPGSPQSPLTSLSWAPSSGRSYHLLATGARDGTVRIWKLTPPGEKLRSNFDQEEMRTSKAWEAELVGDVAKGGARIGMVDWNATGTTLTTSDDEGIVRIYKPNYVGAWKLLGQLTAEEPPSEDGINGQ